jgi:hypothetical protein
MVNPPEKCPISKRQKFMWAALHLSRQGGNNMDSRPWVVPYVFLDTSEEHLEYQLRTKVA